MITRNLSTPENRAFWAAAERASRRVATWPAWKLGQIESREREQESMIEKKTIWDYRGTAYKTELGAMCQDVVDCVLMQRGDSTDECVLTPALAAAIDALHEYAHRVDKAPDTQRDTSSGIVLPEGVPPELDDWVKRWEWITARVSVDAIRELRKGDEVRIGLNWYRVAEASSLNVWVSFTGLRLCDVAFSPLELANIINEVRYNGR